MIRLLVKIGKWLDTRFPEKVVVTKQDYNTLLQRIEAVEQAAVHKGAVQDLVSVVKVLKDDYTSFKASMGFTPKKEDLEALFNGETIHE